MVPGVSRRFGYAFLTQRMNVAAGAAAADVAAARQLDPAGSGYDPGLLADIVIKATSLQEKANHRLRAKGSP